MKNESGGVGEGVGRVAGGFAAIHSRADSLKTGRRRRVVIFQRQPAFSRLQTQQSIRLSANSITNSQQSTTAY